MVPMPSYGNAWFPTALRCAGLGGASIVMHERLVRLEADLRKIQGVSSARVVGNDEPTEIHVVSSPSRPPKQLVRDVQSLATARFGIPIDHRIVSVVQLREGAEAPVAPRRPALERVVLASKGEGGWVKVALQWPDGELTEGAGAAGATRVARAWGATTALTQALGARLGREGVRVEVDDVAINRIGPDDSVVVRAVHRVGGSATALLGSAVIYDDVATASARALLQAVNRKLPAT